MTPELLTYICKAELAVLARIRIKELSGLITSNPNQTSQGGSVR